MPENPKQNDILADIPPDHNCERVNLLLKLRNLSNYIKHYSKVGGDEAEVAKLRRDFQDLQKRLAKGKAIKHVGGGDEGKETKAVSKKYVSEWVPSYASIDLAQHPLLPLPKPANKVLLHGGDILNYCHCLRRNGLQDHCPQYECQGKPQCLTNPIPTCQPSTLGPPPPKPVYISRPPPQKCNENQMRLQKEKLQKEKKMRSIMYLNSAHKYYNDKEPCPTDFKPCWRHDGTYIRKRLYRDKNVQTGEDQRERCRCMENAQSWLTAQYSSPLPDFVGPNVNPKEILSEGVRYFGVAPKLEEELKTISSLNKSVPDKENSVLVERELEKEMAACKKFRKNVDPKSALEDQKAYSTIN